MESRLEKVTENHKNGYNCAQAIACAYSDIINLDEKTVFKLTEGFGLGMGSMKCTCGAVSGATMILSYLLSSGDTEKPVSKRLTYKSVAEISNKFLEENGSLVCAELKSSHMANQRSCADCIKSAAIILEEKLKNI